MKFYLGVAAALVFIVVASLLLTQAAKTSAGPAHSMLPTAEFNDSLPDAFDKFNVTADKRVVIKDLTPQQVMKGMPSVLLVGDSVTFTSKEYFAVIPTRQGGTPTVVEVQSPGEVVKVQKNGRYTLLIFGSAANPHPVALTYVEKTDQASLKREVEENHRREKEGEPLIHS